MSKPDAWKTWEGRMVEGKFLLRQWLGGSDHSAVFLTELPGPRAQKAVIKLMEAEVSGIDAQVYRLRATAKLSYPHLIQTYEAGRCQIDGVPLVYAVLEHADEALSQILPQRPLEPAELGDLLPPLLEALSYLHGAGFVHGHIKPSNVLAVGDQLKLSADQVTAAGDKSSARRGMDVYAAPETATGIVTPASDVWSIGTMIVAASTQTVGPVSGESAHGPGVPKSIAEPYRGIARECLHLDPKRRCSLKEIQARLEPAARSVPAEPEPVVPVRAGSRRPALAVILLIVAVLGILLVGFYLRSRTSASPTSSSQTSSDQTSSDKTPGTIQQPAPQTSAAPGEPVPALPEPPQQPRTTPGEVSHQVLPDIPKSAMNTITGTIKIAVRVQVDSSGKVTEAAFKSAGSSKYFADHALRAAKGWEFSAPQVNGQPTESVWLIQFRFKRTSAQASAQLVKR